MLETPHQNPHSQVTYNELLNAKVAARDRVGMWRIVEDDGMRSARKRRSTNTPLFENNTQKTPMTPNDGETFYGSHFTFEHHSEE